jgi:hypothetical protein
MSILVEKKYTLTLEQWEETLGGSLCVYFFKVVCVKDNIFWGVLCEGTFKTLILLSFKFSIFTYLSHVKFNLIFMFALNFDIIYVF